MDVDAGREASAPEPPAPGHLPVLPQQVAEALVPALIDAAAAGRSPLLLDCTAGLGGHAVHLLRSVAAAGLSPSSESGPPLRLVLCDLDAENLGQAELAARRAADEAGFDLDLHTLHANFVEAPRRLAELGFAADAVLADLGFASTQVDDPSRGLSFKRDGPLDMRFDRSAGRSAADIVNTYPEAELADLIFHFGEERASRRIAAGIVAERGRSPIQTTSQLADVVRRALGSRPQRGPRSKHKPIDPATRTFQALRIAVNDELASLDALLEAVQRGAVSLRAAAAGSWLAPRAAVAIISFHSLEDRRVKRAFAALVERSLARHLTRKPSEARPDEVALNPRARSAKLRAVRLIDASN